MSTARRIDPLLAYNFEVQLMDSTSGLSQPVTTLTLSAVGLVKAGGFSEVSGLDFALDIHDHNEGGNNGGVLKFPTRIKWTNLVLKKGVDNGRQLWEWAYGFAEGKAKRKDGLIILRNEAGRPQLTWGFRRGLPVKYTGPALNAMNSVVAVESIEIAHEGLYVVRGASGLAEAASAVFNAIF